MNAPLKHDPHKTSFYITDALYEEIIADFGNWQRDDLVISDMAERDLFRGLLEHEARLLDQDRLEDWLTLFTPECVYWLPSTPTGGDSRIVSIVCAPAMPGRRNRSHAPSGSSPTSRCSMPAAPTPEWCGPM